MINRIYRFIKHTLLSEKSLVFMKGLIKSVLFVLILFLPTLLFSQTPPPLGITSSFAVFTSVGAVTNSGVSPITGDVGTHSGALSGFSHVTGNIHIADATTAQCATDLTIAYNDLGAQVSSASLGIALGAGQVLTPKVYLVPGASTFSGTMTLDGEGNPNACFVFKLEGALSGVAFSTIILTNGTQACNVFWRVNGALSLEDNSILKGTFVVDGATTLAESCDLDGRLLNISGAIQVATIKASIPQCSNLPIELLSFTALPKDSNVKLNWSTASESNNAHFNLERSADGLNFTSIDEIKGAGSSAETLNYSLLDEKPLDGISYYRLKQTDFDGQTSYSDKKSVKYNFRDELVIKIYPNPFSYETTFHTNREVKNSLLIVYDSYGQKVKQINNFSGQKITLHLEDLSSGLYYVNLLQEGKIIATDKLIIID
jgi:hypothetical protein